MRQRLAGEAIAARLRALERPVDAIAGRERARLARAYGQVSELTRGRRRRRMEKRKSWPASRIERERVLPNWAIYF